MDAMRLITRLAAFGTALPAAVAPVDAEDSRWKPPSGAWSILEIVNHLADEEVRDFRTRVELTLRDPALDWPPIDPERWAREERYNEREFSTSVAQFVAERRTSVLWLRSLREPDWTRSHAHPTAGPMTAGSLLGAWAAHDALHLRQIAKRMYELAGRDSGDSVRYAGEWGA